MSYVGITTSVWIWHPSQATLAEQWKTLVSEFETGAEQRRAKWENSRAVLKLQFDRGVLTTDELQDVWRFLGKQQGAYRSFLVPAYGDILTRIASSYGGGTQLILEQTQDFTTAPSSHWYRLYVEDPAGQFAFFTVASVNGVTTITVTPTSPTSFSVGAWVCPVLLARTTEDLWSRDYLAAMLTTTGLSFTEVRSP